MSVDKTFGEPVEQAVQKHGRELLSDARLCKSFLADYAKGKYTGEIRLLTIILEKGFYREAVHNPDQVAPIKNKFLEQLYRHYSLDKTLVSEMMDLILHAASKNNTPVLPSEKTQLDVEEARRQAEKAQHEVEKIRRQQKPLIAALVVITAAAVIALVWSYQKSASPQPVSVSQPSASPQSTPAPQSPASPQPLAPPQSTPTPQSPAPPQPAPTPQSPTSLQPAPQSPAPQPVSQPSASPQSTPTPQSPANNLVKINGGTFMMGSPASEANRSSDETQHEVTVSSFYIGKYEVTQKEYQAVMGNNPSYFRGDNLPVEQVSWFDAVNYCNARSRKEGFTPAYTVNGQNVTWNRSANGYRLPTEAEWEYACRAGTTTPYYSGISVDNVGWYSSNSEGKTHPVGEKQPNAWGLYDMHGNVWEWCWDWYGAYTAGSATDPQGASSGSSRGIHGGSWFYGGRSLRSAIRGYFDPAGRGSILGFRVVRNN